jgi:geranylgeranyl diphosphate synthase type II
MYNQEKLKDLIEKALVNLSYDTEAEKLIDPVKYVLSIGGKRIRPVLAIMACNLFDDKIEEAVMPALGIEIFHNFTLVHDDIMDQAPLRRNVPTIHSKWNLNQAVLSGDVMAFIANDCFLQAPSWCMSKVFRVFNKAAIEVCIGQQLDIDFEKTAVISEKEYLRMIQLKTAVLIAASAKIGAILGGADDRDSDLLYEFGRNLGLAFQIQDDLLDIYGDVKIFGKIHGGDIISNKKTLLLVKALEAASGDQLKTLHEQFSLKEFDPESKVRTVVDLYDKLKVRSVTEEIAGNYIQTAFDLLDKVAVVKERKEEMTLMIRSLIGRDR